MFLTVSLPSVRTVPSGISSIEYPSFRVNMKKQVPPLSTVTSLGVMKSIPSDSSTVTGQLTRLKLAIRTDPDSG